MWPSVSGLLFQINAVLFKILLIKESWENIVHSVFNIFLSIKSAY